jgi:hypothetical protein
VPIYTPDSSKQAGAFDGLEQKQGHQYPLDVACTVFGRLEPLLTVDQLKTRFLLGIPMTLRVKDPETGKPFKVTDEQLAELIKVHVTTAEEETHTVIMPAQFIEKLPFSRQDWGQFAFGKLVHRPISSLESFNCSLSDGSVAFSFPPTWIESANLVTGQINVIPLAFQAFGQGSGIIGQAATGTATFFAAIVNRDWLAALFTVVYTAGYKDGLVPVPVNQLIGTIVAMDVLSMIAAAYAAVNSSSLGIDGLSQSVSGQGGNRYVTRVKELTDQRNLLVKKIRGKFSTKIVSGSI